jgi:hypothetical protein
MQMKLSALFDSVQGEYCVEVSEINLMILSAKNIKNVVRVNKKRSIEELEVLLKNLQKEVVHLRKYSKKVLIAILYCSANYSTVGETHSTAAKS